MSTPARIVIVSPALADANNGNWQTARRWQELLAPHDVRIVKNWPDPAARKAKASNPTSAQRASSMTQSTKGSMGVLSGQSGKQA